MCKNKKINNDAQTDKYNVSLDLGNFQLKVKNQITKNVDVVA